MQARASYDPVFVQISPVWRLWPQMQEYCSCDQTALDIHLVADNYATHKHAKVRAWLAKHPRFQVHFTPTYSSWINQVERWFGLISQRAIKRGSFTSVSDLVRRIHAFTREYNQNANPFVWVATAQSIIDKIERLSTRISDSAH